MNKGPQKDDFGPAKSRRPGTEPSFSVIADASPEAIINIDERGTIIFVNPATARMFGHGADDLIGKNITVLMPERYRLAHKRGLKKYVATGQGRFIGGTADLHALKSDESEFPIELSLAGWQSAGKVYATGSIRDTTEREQARAELEMSYGTQNVLNELLGLSLVDMPFSEQLQQSIDIILGAPFMPLEPKGGIFLAEEDRPELVMKASRNLPPTLLGLCGKVPFGECLCGRAAAGKKLIFASGVDERHEHRYKGLVPHGHYVVPIISQAGEGKVLGVIVLYVHPGHVRDPHEENFLIAAANTMAGVIERKRAQDALSEGELRYRTLFEQSPDAVVIIDPQSATHIQFNEVAHRQLGYSREEFAKLKISEYEAIETPAEIRTHMERVLQRGYETFETQHFAKDGDIREVLVRANAIRLAGRTVFLTIYHDITEQKRAKTFSDALNEINGAINSTLDLNRIMQRVVEESSKAIGCDKGVIYLREEDRWAPKHVYRFPRDLIGVYFSDAEAPFARRAAETGEPVISYQPEYSKTQRCELMAQYSVKSLLAVPLFTKEETVGSLMFAYDSTKPSFSDTEIDFVKKLASAVALAVENSSLYAREHRIAHTLQEALLTFPEKIPGIDFGHLYQSSAAEVAKTGGDFYDLFELEHDKIGILIGDVSGKGLEAATLTSLVKNTIKAYAYQKNSPAQIIAMTNNVVSKTSEADTFATLFFGILDLDSRTLTYCNAGHPPPIVKRRTTGPTTLATENPAIAMFPDLRYADSQESLEPGDTLVLFTDGVIEAKCGKELYGEKRLVNFIGSLKTSQAKEIPRLIFEEVEVYSSCALFDDVAILTISLRSSAD